MDILNRIRLVDTVLGESSYHRDGSDIGLYFTKAEADSVVDRIISTESKYLDFKTLKFLNKQSDDMLEIAREMIYENNSYINNYLEISKSEGIVKFTKIEDVELFRYIVRTKYQGYAKDLIDAANEGSSVDKIRILLEVSDEYDWTPSSYQVGEMVGCNELIELSKCDIIFDYDKSSIDRIVRLIKNKFDIEYAHITREQLKILNDDLAWYIRDLDENQLNMVRELTKVVDKDELIDINEMTLLYDFHEDVIRFLEAATEASIDNNELNDTICSFVDSVIYGIVSNVEDIRLLTNKLKYGVKLRDNNEYCAGLTGIAIEKLKEYGLNHKHLVKLVRMKRFVSKGFYKAFVNNEELASTLYKIYDVGILESISNIIELGQLNSDQIKELMDLIYSFGNTIYDRLNNYSVGFKISFEEFKIFLKNHSIIDAEYISTLKDMKQTERLLKIKERIEIRRALRKIGDSINKDDILKTIEGIEVSKSMKKNNPLKIKDMGDYLVYLFVKSHMNIDSREDFDKIRFISKHRDFDSVKLMNMQEIEECIWQSKSVNDLMTSLGLSDEFKETYKDNIFKFCLSDNFRLVTLYMENYKVRDNQIQGILLITKAIMAGKYEDLKFVYSDIEKETSLNISTEAFNNWKTTDIIEKNQYTVKDASDFRTIMTIGEVPVKSCMHYESGLYSHCLLSNFDTSKKILTIHKNGTYVGRAILRLTLMSDVDREEANLSFLDVDSQDAEVGNTPSKQLIIFLEKTYTTLDSGDLKEVYPYIVELLKEKANKMGAKLVVSSYYSGCVGEDCTSDYKYVFITASKNGAQYLDSFDGSTSSAYCYKNGKVYIY